ncbi:hypothetical protein LXL04_029535 [Taraxacum kok-saghyz]
MEKIFASFTIITFILFAVATARISLNQPATNLPAVQSSNDESKTMKSLPGPTTTEDSNIVLPSEKPESNSDKSGHTPEGNKKDQIFKVDLTPRSEYARFHAINRRFFDEHRTPLHSGHRRPNQRTVNPFAVPRSEISHRMEAALFGETGKVNSQNFHRKAPLNRLRYRHDSGHRHHRHQYRHHLQHGNNDVSVQKHAFTREKLKSSMRQHKEKKSRREHEASFMKGIRKFLKHTFD